MILMGVLRGSHSRGIRCGKVVRARCGAGRKLATIHSPNKRNVLRLSIRSSWIWPNSGVVFPLVSTTADPGSADFHKRIQWRGGARQRISSLCDLGFFSSSFRRS